MSRQTGASRVIPGTIRSESLGVISHVVALKIMDLGQFC